MVALPRPAPVDLGATVRRSPEAPSSAVGLMVVGRAEQVALGEVGSTSVGEGLSAVVGLAPGRWSVAAGSDAAAVHPGQGVTLVGGEQTLAAPEVDRHARPAQHRRQQPVVARETAQLTCGQPLSGGQARCGDSGPQLGLVDGDQDPRRGASGRRQPVDRQVFHQRDQRLARFPVVRLVVLRFRPCPRYPIAARVEDVMYQAGEWAAANAPIISLVPDDQVKVRFYVPQAMVSAYTPGATVAIACDGCASGMTARVNYVASRPEYTPPIIYSLTARDKLVFLVEAAPSAPRALMPGQPIDVTPLKTPPARR